MDVVTYDRMGDIALVTVDHPPVNAINRALREGLIAAVETADADPKVKAVVLVCAGRSFIAGADVREFDSPPEQPHLPEVTNRIDGAAKPWTAAIHGTALGGGLEIAMACRFRAALASAKLGLPEVTLGLVPGAGGTVRTPRLIGLEAAVDLVTSGRPISAKTALALGLVDTLIEGELRTEAIAFATGQLGRNLPSRSSEREVATMPESFWDKAQKTAAKAGYAAPLRALDLLRYGIEKPIGEAMSAERQAFLELRASDEARALRHVFFAERAAPKPAALKGVAARDIAVVGVVGGGTMGAGIAAAFRDAGMEIRLIERDDAAVARGIETIGGVFAGAVKRGKLDEAGRADRMAGVSGSTDYATLAGADLVIEAVFEEIGVKRAVFAELGRVCRPDAILATNTSYIDPREIAEGLPAPERFIGLHFFSPAHIMKLLEIVPIPETAPEVLATAFALARTLRKIPVRAGICEGFIGNRILKRYRAEAEALVLQGVPIAEVDKAMRGYGFRMGPFEAQDLGGLDIAFLQREGARAAGQNVPETLGDVLVRAGRKGQKTGGGWYDYAANDRTPASSPQVDLLLAEKRTTRLSLSTAEIADRLVAAMAGEGQLIVAEGIARTPGDIDLVEIHGYGFPRWKGGPMFACGMVN